MQEFGLIKSLPESLWLSEGQFFRAFPRAQSALFLISILSSFQGMLKVSSLQWSWCNLCRGSWQMPTPSQQGPHIWPCFGYVSCPLCSAVPGRLIPVPEKILLIGHSVCCYWTRPCEQQKSLDHTCLTSLLVQENIPSCCFFPYLELHYYNHWYHGTFFQHFITGSVTHLLT